MTISSSNTSQVSAAIALLLFVPAFSIGVVMSLFIAPDERTHATMSAKQMMTSLCTELIFG